MRAKPLPGSLNMAVRTRESISMTVGVMGSLSTGGPTEVVGDTPSCKLNDPVTSVVVARTGGGCFNVDGDCFTGGVVNVVTGVFTGTAGDRGVPGGIFTGGGES